jgi:hypothetical protein
VKRTKELFWIAIGYGSLFGTGGAPGSATRRRASLRERLFGT